MKKIVKLLFNKNSWVTTVITIYLFFDIFSSFRSWTYFEQSFIQSIFDRINTVLSITLFILMTINFSKFIRRADKIINKQVNINTVTNKENVVAFFRNIVSLLPLLLLKFLKVFYKTNFKNVEFTFQQNMIFTISAFLLISSTLISCYIVLIYCKSSEYDEEDIIDFKMLIWLQFLKTSKIKKTKKANEIENSNCFVILVAIILHWVQNKIELIFKMKKSLNIINIKKSVLPL